MFNVRHVYHFCQGVISQANITGPTNSGNMSHFCSELSHLNQNVVTIDSDNELIPLRCSQGLLLRKIVQRNEYLEGNKENY